MTGDTAPRLKRLSLVATRGSSPLPPLGTSSNLSVNGAGGSSANPSPGATPTASAYGSAVESLRPTPSPDPSSSRPRPTPSPANSRADSRPDSRDTTTHDEPRTLIEIHSPSPRRLKRSSIAYAPSPEAIMTQAYHSRSGNVGYSPSTERHARTSSIAYSHSHTGRSGSLASERYSEDTERSEDKDEPLTLAEKHADLLRMIAMRERRVNELKQELAAQEQALASLRTRWTALARADIAQPQQPRPTSPTPNPLAQRAARASLTSSTASTSSLPTVPDDEPPSLGLPGSVAGLVGATPAAAIGGLWNAITQDADDTIQEGKRFWGQLLRTVGAAAGGNVPDQSGKLERQVSNGHRRGQQRRQDSRSPVPPDAGTLGAGAARNTLRTPSPAVPTKSPPPPANEGRLGGLGLGIDFSDRKSEDRQSDGVERRSSVRLKRAALSPKPSSPRPRVLTGGESPTEKGKDLGVAAVMESVGW